MKTLHTKRYYESSVREIAEKLGIQLTPNQFVVIHEKGRDEEYALDGSVTIVVTETKP